MFHKGEGSRMDQNHKIIPQVFLKQRGQLFIIDVFLTWRAVDVGQRLRGNLIQIISHPNRSQIQTRSNLFNPLPHIMVIALDVAWKLWGWVITTRLTWVFLDKNVSLDLYNVASPSL